MKISIGTQPMGLKDRRFDQGFGTTLLAQISCNGGNRTGFRVAQRR